MTTYEIPRYLKRMLSVPASLLKDGDILFGQNQGFTLDRDAEESNDFPGLVMLNSGPRVPLLYVRPHERFDIERWTVEFPPGSVVESDLFTAVKTSKAGAWFTEKGEYDPSLTDETLAQMIAAPSAYIKHIPEDSLEVLIGGRS